MAALLAILFFVTIIFLLPLYFLLKIKRKVRTHELRKDLDETEKWKREHGAA
jgi:hypothetical protein